LWLLWSNTELFWFKKNARKDYHHLLRKYTLGPVFFVWTVLLGGRRQNIIILSYKWLAPSLPLEHFTGQKVLQLLYWLLTWVQSQVISSETRGAWRGTGVGFPLSSLVSPANHYFTFAPYSSITAPWGMQQPWLGSTLSCPQSEVRGFISDLALGWSCSKIV
jgi:hypothetical protein